MAGCLAFIGGAASGMGAAATVYTIAFFGVVDLLAVFFLTWFESGVKDCRLGMVSIEAILWFVGFLIILLV